MASYREMDAVGRDRSRFVAMAKQCLLLPVNEWERKFLDSLISGSETIGGPPERLSVRQMETLFEIRDEYELHSTLYGGFSVPTMIQRVYEARLDLSEDDEDWITALHNSSIRQLRRSAIGRLRRCAVQLGEIEPHMGEA
jgi:hypothetical protein